MRAGAVRAGLLVGGCFLVQLVPFGRKAGEGDLGLRVTGGPPTGNSQAMQGQMAALGDKWIDRYPKCV